MAFIGKVVGSVTAVALMFFMPEHCGDFGCGAICLGLDLEGRVNPALVLFFPYEVGTLSSY